MNKKIAMVAAIMALAAGIAPALAQAADSPAGAAMGASNQALRNQLQTERHQLQTERTQLNQQANANQAQNQTAKTQLDAARCQNIQTRLGDRIATYQNTKQTFGTAYTDMQARLQQLSDKLGGESIDVTQLNSDIQTLSAKIATLTQDHSAFITSLQTAQTTAATACQTTPTTNAFMTQIQASRAAALTAQKDNLDIRSFFQTTLRPEIMAIRTKVAATVATPAPATTSVQ